MNCSKTMLNISTQRLQGTALLTLCLLVQSFHTCAHATDVIVVNGAPGLPEYTESFMNAAAVWRETCDRAKFEMVEIKSGKDLVQREALQTALSKLADEESTRPLWVVLIGHGTWDGKTANFNLVGPDVSARVLSKWIQPIRRPVVILNCASCSGPFVDRLSGTGRVVVAATKSGNEQNVTRFASYIADAIGSVSADLDHDDEVSVREAFLKAVSEVEAFYREQGRLASEHAILDDNGDRKGSSYKMVRGTATAKSGKPIDGSLAAKLSIPATTTPLKLTEEQRKQREELESELDTLKQAFAADRNELRKQVAPVFKKLAAIYAAAEKANKLPSAE